MFNAKFIHLGIFGSTQDIDSAQCYSSALKSQHKYSVAIATYIQITTQTLFPVPGNAIKIACHQDVVCPQSWGRNI